MTAKCATTGLDADVCFGGCCVPATAEETLRERLLAALPESLGPISFRRPAVPLLNVGASVTGYGDLLVDALLPAVREIIADEIEQLAERCTWTTEHDNEVVSARDLYEQVARLRGELEPVTYDFPPDAGDQP